MKQGNVYLTQSYLKTSISLESITKDIFRSSPILHFESTPQKVIKLQYIRLLLAAIHMPLRFKSEINERFIIQSNWINATIIHTKYHNKHVKMLEPLPGRLFQGAQ